MAAAAHENTGTCGRMTELQQFFMQLTNKYHSRWEATRNVCLLMPFDYEIMSSAELNDLLLIFGQISNF